MESLSTPSKKVLSQIVQEVDFKDRIIGYSVNFRSGPDRISLYSLEEVFALLNAPHPQIDFNQLAMWVRDIIQDEELADKIKTVIAHKASNRDKVSRIRDLIGRRLVQCKLDV
jgi:hypothetical protein